jgi:hypothetical protein
MRDFEQLLLLLLLPLQLLPLQRCRCQNLQATAGVCSCLRMLWVLCICLPSSSSNSSSRCRMHSRRRQQETMACRSPGVELLLALLETPGWHPQRTLLLLLWLLSDAGGPELESQQACTHIVALHGQKWKAHPQDGQICSRMHNKQGLSSTCSTWRQILKGGTHTSWKMSFRALAQLL